MIVARAQLTAMPLPRCRSVQQIRVDPPPPPKARNGGSYQWYQHTERGGQGPLWVKIAHTLCKKSCPLVARKRTCAVQRAQFCLGYNGHIGVNIVHWCDNGKTQ